MPCILRITYGVLLHSRLSGIVNCRLKVEDTNILVIVLAVQNNKTSGKHEVATVDLILGSRWTWGLWFGRF